MKRILILSLVILFIATITPILWAGDIRPWRDLPPSDIFKNTTIDCVKVENTFLAGELKLKSGDYFATFYIQKIGNKIFRSLHFAHTDLTATKYKVRHYSLILDGDQCTKASCLLEIEARIGQERRYNIGKIDPEFLIEIAKYYKEVEKIFFSKITDPKIKEFIKALK